VKRWLPLVAFSLALAAAAPRLLPPDAPRFAMPAPAATVSPAPTFSARLIPNPQPSAHAATLAELPDGRIAAAWFAGSEEGARDVAIHFSTFDGKQWQTPAAIVTRERVQRDTARLVRKLGNPVLAADGTGKLHLWFVSVGYGGWAGSSINHALSGDGGKTWSAAGKLVTSPFWNVSTLVRTPALALAKGEIALPAYHEFAAKHAEWLRLDEAGNVRDKARIPASQRTLQPAVAALDASRAVAMMRDTGPANRIRLAATADGGATWQPARATELPNPNAAVALLRLADGRLLLAWNPQAANRDKLALSLSRDAGMTWTAPKFVEDSAGGEFSYPALLQGRDGTVHLAYTWQRRSIKHLAFTPAWLEPAR
jgi:predicted neuraminidase